jgi:hypothetical protein
MAGEPFERHRRDALELLADARATLRRLDRGKAADDIQEARDQLATGKVTAAVFGEFKRGKSRLLGALVEVPAFFPSDVDIATNLVTTLEYVAAVMPEAINRAQSLLATIEREVSSRSRNMLEFLGRSAGDIDASTRDHDKVLQAADQPAPASAAAMSSVARQLRQILALEGVVAIEEDGEYDAARQRVVDTADPGQDYQVAASVRPGYRRERELLRHQDVVLFRCREDSGEGGT